MEYKPAIFSLLSFADNLSHAGNGRRQIATNDGVAASAANDVCEHGEELFRALHERPALIAAETAFMDRVMLEEATNAAVEKHFMSREDDRALGNMPAGRCVPTCSGRRIWILRGLGGEGSYCRAQLHVKDDNLIDWNKRRLTVGKRLICKVDGGTEAKGLTINTSAETDGVGSAGSPNSDLHRTAQILRDDPAAIERGMRTPST